MLDKNRKDRLVQKSNKLTNDWLELLRSRFTRLSNKQAPSREKRTISRSRQRFGQGKLVLLFSFLVFNRVVCRV